jgi:ElaB/YqjD/DUF883 family membrane-anchored ribosome-binding protein
MAQLEPGLEYQPSAANGFETEMDEGMAVVKNRVNELRDIINKETKAFCEATDAQVRSNPWQAVGVAAGLGFLVGFLFLRR